jgi:hypothetical protein
MLSVTLARGSSRNSPDAGSSRIDRQDERDSKRLQNSLTTPSETLSEGRRSAGAIDRVSFVLLGAGFAVVLLGTICFGAVGGPRYESVLLSFGVFVFTSGITLYSWDRKLQGTYMTYMWIATFIILASITGFSALGTYVKP